MGLSVVGSGHCLRGEVGGRSSQQLIFKAVLETESEGPWHPFSGSGSVAGSNLKLHGQPRIAEKMLSAKFVPASYTPKDCLVKKRCPYSARKCAAPMGQELAADISFVHQRFCCWLLQPEWENGAHLLLARGNSRASGIPLRGLDLQHLAFHSQLGGGCHIVGVSFRGIPPKASLGV